MKMKIGAPKEVESGEARVAITPQSAKDLQKLGYEVAIEAGAGEAAGFSDKDYQDAGVNVAKTAAALWKDSDIIAKIRPPRDTEVKRFHKDQTLLSLIYPAQDEKLVKALNDKQVTTIAMDMVPRISRAQKMDVLSSMANIAGYRAVIEASNNFGRFFTGQVTAAGKIPPAKVLVVGAETKKKREIDRQKYSIEDPKTKRQIVNSQTDRQTETERCVQVDSQRNQHL